MTWLWWRHRIEYAAFLMLFTFCRLLPTWGVILLAHSLATFLCSCLPRKLTRYTIASENLRQAFPGIPDDEVQRLIYGMWVHLVRMLCEISQLQTRLRLQDVYDVMEFRNRDKVVRTMLGDRPVLFVSGHLGNWEIAVRVLGNFGFPMGVVARELDNPLLNRWFARFRQATGHTLIDKDGGSGQMVATLERGGCLALLGDQDAGRSGAFIDFFGRPASTNRGIALLALQYNAIIVVGGVVRLSEQSAPWATPSKWVKFEMTCEEIIDPLEVTSNDPVREILERYQAALEQMISRAPEQYFWVHRRWKTQPGERRKKRTAPRAA